MDNDFATGYALGSDSNGGDKNGFLGGGGGGGHTTFPFIFCGGAWGGGGGWWFLRWNFFGVWLGFFGGLAEGLWEFLELVA